MWKDGKYAKNENKKEIRLYYKSDDLNYFCSESLDTRSKFYEREEDRYVVFHEL